VRPRRPCSDCGNPTRGVTGRCSPCANRHSMETQRRIERMDVVALHKAFPHFSLAVVGSAVAPPLTRQRVCQILAVARNRGIL
jgi:predicted ATP-dependent serine protease